MAIENPHMEVLMGNKHLEMVDLNTQILVFHGPKYVISSSTVVYPGCFIVGGRIRKPRMPLKPSPILVLGILLIRMISLWEPQMVSCIGFGLMIIWFNDH
jgi:hypothetical protein